MEELKVTEKYSKTLKLLGNPTRLKILTIIKNKKCRVSKVQEILQESLPLISQQIAVLRKAKIIEGERNKNEIYYKIVDDFALKVMELMK